ncbi:MAG: hypothetical protein R3Y26_04185 [Rikenellaceae bacterium]
MKDLNLKSLKYRAIAPVIGVKQNIEGARYNYKQSTENQEDMTTAMAYYSALNSIRRERRRNIRYKNGEQWSDFVPDPDNPGKMIEEQALIVRQGKNPLKHNFIQQYIRNIAGQAVVSERKSVVICRSTDDIELGEMLTNALQQCTELNRFDSLRINAVEELILAGIVVGKVRYDFWSEKNRGDARIDNVNFERVFFNTDIEDPRFMNDVNFIGEIHDYTYEDLLRNFASTLEDEEELSHIYSNHKNRSLVSAQEMKSSKMDTVNISGSSVTGDKCRVLEIWKKQGRWVTYIHDYGTGEEYVSFMTLAEVEQVNKQRKQQLKDLGLDSDSINVTLYAEEKYEHFWNVKFLTADGWQLKAMETPYTHESHPYVVSVLPMNNGGIRSAIGDLIDSQRYINRLIVLIDSIISNSAKGVLMIPESAIPEGLTIDDFASEYVKSDGMIVYRDKVGGDKPYQITKNSTNIGATDMLSLQHALFKEISGLSGALQGHQASSNKPASLYAQEAQNSSLNFAVLFKSLSLYEKAVSEKTLKVIMQYYTDTRYVDIAGSSMSETAKLYDPEKVKNIVDFYVCIEQSISSPVFKLQTEEALLDMLKSRLIPLDVFLENSQMPYAKKIQTTMKSINEKTE